MDEDGAELVRSLADVVVSAVARVEVAGAIRRKQRMGELPPAAADVLVRAFAWDWVEGVFAVVGLVDDVLERAVRLLDAHPLRAYDAIQLGSALAARELGCDVERFICYDGALAAAAGAEGLEVVD